MSVTSVSSDAHSSAYDSLNESEVRETNSDRKNVKVETNAVALGLLSSPEVKQAFTPILENAERIYHDVKQVRPKSTDENSCADLPESSIPDLIQGIKSGENVMDKLVGLALTLRRLSEDLNLMDLRNEGILADINQFIQEHGQAAHDQYERIKSVKFPSLAHFIFNLKVAHRMIRCLVAETNLCIQDIGNNVPKLGVDRTIFLTLLELNDCVLRLRRCFGDESGSCDQRQSVKEALALLRPAAAHLGEIEGDMQDSAHYVAEISEKLATAETVEEANAILNQYGGSVAILKNVKPLSIKNPLGSIFFSLVYAHDTPEAERELEMERIAAELVVGPLRTKNCESRR